MATKTALAITVNVDGVRPIMAALRKLPEGASDALRDGSLKLSRTLANKIRAAARAEGSQAAAVAPTVAAVRDRVPAITAGGTQRVASTRVPAKALIFGSEFGARRRFGWYAERRYRGSTGRQYKRHRGRGSYWFFKTAEQSTATINTAWQKVADDIVNSFRVGG